MLLLDLIFSLLFLMMTFNLKNLYAFNAAEKKMINWVFVFHTAVCFAATPILLYGGDARHYWMYPKTEPFEVIWGLVVETPRPSQIMFLLNYFPSNVLNLSFLPGMLLYSLLGFWAFLLIMLIVKSFIPDLSKLNDITLARFPIYPYIFLLPNMHFWSVGIGKDSLLFFSVSIILYSLMNVRKRWLGLMIGVAIGYYLRPHVLLFLAAGYGLAMILSAKLSLFQKIAFAAVGSAIFFPLLNNVLEFAKIEAFTTEHIEDFSSGKSSALSKAGSGVDFSNYPYIAKVMTFVFRPFFFDINGIPAFIASVENLIQLLLFYFFFKNRSLPFIFKSNIIIRASFFYFVIGALAFAPVMSNLGIIIREKNMLMPAFLIFVLASVKYKQITLNNNGQN